MENYSSAVMYETTLALIYRRK